MLDLNCYYCNIGDITTVTFMEITMRKTPRISEAEWEVMKVLWKKSPMTANDIVKELTGKTHWKRETIRTLINRLVGKKVLKFSRKRAGSTITPPTSAKPNASKPRPHRSSGDSAPGPSSRCWRRSSKMKSYPQKE